MDSGKPADLPDMLNLLRLQRHDFINHLQVVSGFLQLAKTDRALDYIHQVTGKLHEDGKLLRLERPQLVAAILLLTQMAEREQVSLVARVQVEPRFLPDRSDDDLAELINTAVNLLLDSLRRCPPRPRVLELSISEAGGLITIRLSLDTGGEEIGFSQEALKAACRSLLERCGAGLAYNDEGGRIETVLTFRRSPD